MILNSCDKSKMVDGLSHKKICQFDVQKTLCKEIKLTGIILYRVQKTKKNNKHEILTHFTYRRYSIQV